MPVLFRRVFYNVVLLALILLGTGSLWAQPVAALSAPALSAFDLEGNWFDLREIVGSAQTGKAVLMVFYANNCHYCLEEVPLIKKVRASLKGKPALIVYVNAGDEEGDVRRIATKYKIDFRILLDPYQNLYQKAYTTLRIARGLPMAFLVAPGGQVLFKKAGLATQKELLKAFDKALPKRGKKSRKKAKKR